MSRIMTPPADERAACQQYYNNLDAMARWEEMAETKGDGKVKEKLRKIKIARAQQRALNSVKRPERDLMEMND